MNIHVAILTQGNQVNIDRLMGDVFWKSVWGRIASIHLLSQGGGSVQIGSPNLNFPHIKYYEISQNLGCAGGRKFLTEKIMKSRFCGEGFDSEDAIIFLDDDVIVCSEDWIRLLCEPLLMGYSISGVAGRRVVEDALTIEDTLNYDYVSGGWCAIRGDVFLDGCDFDTDRFFPNYYEDIDICWQAKARNKRIIAVGNIGLIHDDNPIGRDMVKVSKYVDDNRVKFAEKWGLKL